MNSRSTAIFQIFSLSRRATSVLRTARPKILSTLTSVSATIRIISVTGCVRSFVDGTGSTVRKKLRPSAVITITETITSTITIMDFLSTPVSVTQLLSRLKEQEKTSSKAFTLPLSEEDCKTALSASYRSIVVSTAFRMTSPRRRRGLSESSRTFLLAPATAVASS